MEKSGQLHTLATVPPVPSGTEPEQEAGRVDLNVLGEKKSLASVGNGTPDL